MLVGEGVGWGVTVSSGGGVGKGEGMGVGVDVGVGVGVGWVVGMGMGFLGRTSRSEASETFRVLVDLLYFPAAKILRAIKFFKSILAGMFKVIASDEEVSR